MPVDVAFDNLPPFPKRLPEKLETIRARLGLTPDEIARKVGARTGAELLAYENDQGEFPLSVLWGYARVSGNSIMNSVMTDWKLIGVRTKWTPVRKRPRKQKRPI